MLYWLTTPEPTDQFFKKTFQNSLRFTEKLQIVQSFHLSLTQFPLLITSYITMVPFVTTKEPTLVHYYNYAPHFFHISLGLVSRNVLFLVQDPIQDILHLVIMSLQPSLVHDGSSAFVFDDLDIFKEYWNNGQVFCRMSLDFGLLDIFLIIRHVFLWGKPQRNRLFSSHHIKGTYY